MKFIDLSTTISQDPPFLPDALRTDLKYTSHAEGAEQVQQMMGVPAELLRNGEGWAVEEFTRFGTHNSTHVDAPWHYNSTIQGRPARTIDELPLEWFYSDGVVFDFTSRGDGEAADVADFEAELQRIDYKLKPLDIVLVRTGADVHLGKPDYMFHGCGVTAAATHWLHERGVRVMGIDAWGWDQPLNLQAQAALKARKPGIFWAAHQADLEYSQIERLTNVAALPPHGFRVACFPLKIERGSAAPARVVALLPD